MHNAQSSRSRSPLQHCQYEHWLPQVGIDALTKAAAPEEEGGRGKLLDKNTKRRIVLVSLVPLVSQFTPLLFAICRQEHQALHCAGKPHLS